MVRLCLSVALVLQHPSPPNPRPPAAGATVCLAVCTSLLCPPPVILSCPRLLQLSPLWSGQVVLGMGGGGRCDPGRPGGRGL